MMTDSNHLVVLVDGSSYLFRAYHALPNLTSKQGHPTGALHGVMKMLTKLYEDLQPAYFAVVFDAKGKTFRHDLFPEYKANRKKADPELIAQIEPLHQLVEAMGFPLIVETGVEADDVIGTLAHQALSEHYQVLISSGDKDMAQLLVNGNITLLDTMKNATTTAENVHERFKVPALKASQVIDFLALMGDDADNIPGIPKVGEKTAAKWLSEYETLDNLIDNASRISGKIGENLRAHLAQLPLSKALATIKTDVELSLSIHDLSKKPVQSEKLLALCEQYDLHQLKRHASAQSALPLVHTPQTQSTTHYHTLQTLSEVEALAQKLQAQKRFALDTETNSLNYMDADLVGLSLALEWENELHAYYLPFSHQLAVNLPLEESLKALRPVLQSPQMTIIGQHLKYDRHILSRYGIELSGICEDTMLMSYAYHSTNTRHNLDDLAKYYLNHQTTTFEELAGKGTKQLTFDQIPLQQASHYACEDAEVTYRLAQCFDNKLQAEPKLKALYKTLERPLSPVLESMERLGVKVDSQALKEQSALLSKQLQSLEEQAYLEAGMMFNLASPKQLQSILYEQLKLPVLVKTPKGQPSTNEDALEALCNDHPLPRTILAHRSLAKLKSTYTDRLPELINPKTGRIHTSYHQAVTSTGRLSSSEPNLQNIPIRTEEGRKIRSAFIAPEGFQILAADYSQIELRIMAHLSGDEGLQSAFQQGEDIHRSTASEIFHTPISEVTQEQRRNAKAINFGLIYGMSAFGLSRQLGISRYEANDYINAYFNRFPKVREFMESTRQSALHHGYVETLLGRRLYLPEINSKNPTRRQASERLAINAPMQGSAADIIKLAMLAVMQELKHEQSALRLIMQVHDELVFELQIGREDLIPTIKKLMEQALTLSVPLIVETGLGNNWDKAH
ncbi:MAG: DNA polymerase I [Cardiobacteriaceae bacterium]|nr:DNA polymerase I [Cardiobacteriaceae bacterium]